MHGEDAGNVSVHVAVVETPPRAWGRLLYSLETLSVFGNTPTCMGKTVYQYFSITILNGNTPTCMGKTACDIREQDSFWKHPHVHGEDAINTVNDFLKQETPPRAWGRR